MTVLILPSREINVLDEQLPPIDAALEILAELKRRRQKATNNAITAETVIRLEKAGHFPMPRFGIIEDSVSIARALHAAGLQNLAAVTKHHYPAFKPTPATSL